MRKTMRIPNVFDTFHNLMLVLFMIKVAAVAFAFRVNLLAESAIAQFRRKKAPKMRNPKGKLIVSMN